MSANLSTNDDNQRPKVSVVVVCYNMARELPRTIYSLSPQMQRGIDPSSYEVILVDNGSSAPVDEGSLRTILPGLVIRRVTDPAPSPVAAVNLGLSLARGELTGVCIDGARMASPGLLSSALAASTLHPRPVIGTIAFHLGPKNQMRSVQEGYDQVTEDILLASCGWQDDGYRLFDISSLAGSSSNGWFVLPVESNAFFLKTEHWRRVGGYDERFRAPGGGLANIDTWQRLCDDPENQVIMLLGEATFHQVHGGIATNSPSYSRGAFYQEYQAIRGKPFAPSRRRPLFFGSLPAGIEASLKASVEQLSGQAPDRMKASAH